MRKIICSVLAILLYSAVFAANKENEAITWIPSFDVGKLHFSLNKTNSSNTVGIYQDTKGFLTLITQCGTNKKIEAIAV